MIFSQLSSCISFDTNSGAIGDTIGGITSPFVNLLGAILIYISFREQVESNKQQIENQNIDRFRSDYEEIKNEYHRVEINEEEIEQVLRQAKYESPLELYSIDLELKKEGNITFEYQFKYVLHLIIYFIDEVENSNLNYNSKKLFINKLYQFYYSRLEYHLERIQEISEDCNYSVPFTILCKKVTTTIELEMKKYKIEDSGTM